MAIEKTNYTNTNGSSNRMTIPSFPYSKVASLDGEEKENEQGERKKERNKQNNNLSRCSDVLPPLRPCFPNFLIITFSPLLLL